MVGLGAVTALTDFDLYARGAETMLAAWEGYARGAADATVRRLPGVTAGAVELVGGISAVPCDVEGGCSYGVVDLRIDHRSVGTHLIDCLAPRALHVVSANEHYACVFACRTVYQWRLHRLV